MFDCMSVSITMVTNTSLDYNISDVGSWAFCDVTLNNQKQTCDELKS